MGENPAEVRRQAVHAWIAWRKAQHAARGGHGEDALVSQLRRYMRDGGMKLESLGVDSLDRVLDQIAALDWSTRPFGGPASAQPAPSSPPPAPAAPRASMADLL